MTTIYRPNNVRRNTRANITNNASGPVAENTSLAEFWSREHINLYETWQAGNDGSIGSNDPYFQYFYTGQDISITIEGLPASDFLPLYAFGYVVEQQKQPVYGFWDYCVDDQTEALTQRGWLSGDNLTEDDIILSMDPISKELKWSTIKSIYRNPNFDGKLFQLKNRNIDALVTPGHKFPLKDGRLVPVEELRVNDSIQLMGSAVDDRTETYTDAFVELVGWFITEGHIRKDCNAVEIDQSIVVNPDKLDRIELCLKRLNVQYSKYKPRKNGVVKLYIGVKNSIVNELKRVAPNKIPTYDFITALSTSQREILIETMIDGDGSRNKYGSSSQYGQGRHCVDQLDPFMALCAMNGLVTHKGALTKNGQTTVTISRIKNCQVGKIDFAGGFVKGEDNVPTVAYRGLVWCPETEYGTFVSRRKGKVSVTGNTYSAVLRGTRIVSGAFSLVVSDGPMTMTRMIAKAADIRARSITSRSRYNSNLNPVRGLDQDESNINQFWYRHYDNNLESKQQHLFSVHPPFNLVIEYGLQETSLALDNPSRRADELRNKYAGNGIISTDYNERLVRSADQANDYKTLIESVELTSMSTQFDTDGTPILETYSFIARDQRLISSAIYDRIQPLPSGGPPGTPQPV